MLTYVINTSENKVLKSEVLFDLVGYNKIVWMRSGLSAIDECAEEILRRQEPMTASEYRVVVIVDFLAFEKTLFPEEYPVSEYLLIYRKLIEIYLYRHLYNKLYRTRLGFDGLEVFYIQYCEKNTIRENAAEKTHTSELLSPESDKDDEGNTQTVLSAPQSLFRMRYQGGELVFHSEEICKDVAPGTKVSYDVFYESLADQHNIAYRSFGSRSRTYVAESASARMESRAAFDNLNLSLALIRAYEQEIKLDREGEKRDDVVDLPKMDKNAFFDIIRRSYGKVRSALELVRQDGKASGFYCLKTKEEVTEDILCSELKESEKQKVAMQAKEPSFEDQYVAIKAFAAARPGEKSEAEKEELSSYMSEYKEGRDSLRNQTTDADKRLLLREAERQPKYPSGLEYENAVEKKKKTMRTILGAAIDADYKGADYTEEFEEANAVYDRYTRAEAALSKNFYTHLGCLILVLVAMIVPYLVLQQTYFSRFGAGLLAGIAAAVFGGVYIFSAFVHMIPLIRAKKLARLRMTALYESCLLKQRMAMLELKRRYTEYLPAVEKIRYEIYTLHVLHEANREINRHIEEHREMLEKLSDVLRGMLNSMQVTHRVSEDVALEEDEFMINESIRANRIYKVFTIDAIESVFFEGRA